MENKTKKSLQEEKSNKGDKLKGILWALKDFLKNLLKSFLFLFLFLFFFFLIILMALKFNHRIPTNTFPGILFYGLMIIILMFTFGFIIRRCIGPLPIFIVAFFILPIFLGLVFYFRDGIFPITKLIIITSLSFFFFFYNFLKERKLTTEKQDLFFYGLSFVFIAGLLIWAYFFK